VNTPTHVLLNWALLGRGAGRSHERAILLGALLPDLPMFVFWLWQTLARGWSQREIWDRIYFDPQWQLIFDSFNSIPLYVGAALVGLWARHRAATFCAASALLHLALDFPFHREDAHGHWLPFSGWRFVSPVSYWDPAHYGDWFSAVELGAFLAAAVAVARRHESRWIRGAIGAVAMGCLAAWAAAHRYL